MSRRRQFLLVFVLAKCYLIGDFRFSCPFVYKFSLRSLNSRHFFNNKKYFAVYQCSEEIFRKVETFNLSVDKVTLFHLLLFCFFFSFSLFHFYNLKGCLWEATSNVKPSVFQFLINISRPRCTFSVKKKTFARLIVIFLARISVSGHFLNNNWIFYCLSLPANILDTILLLKIGTFPFPVFYWKFDCLSQFSRKVKH